MSWDATISLYVGQVCEQLVVRPEPDLAAVLDHQDLVGVTDGRDPLRHDDGHRVGHHRRERGAERGIGGEVERGERVVEEVDAGSAHEGPGDGEALALAAGDVGAALRDRGVEATGHRAHERLGLGDLERLPQLVVGGVGIRVAEVARHGAR